MFRRAMDYLGLGPDEAYDNYDESVAVQRDRRMPNRGRAMSGQRDQQRDEYSEYDKYDDDDDDQDDFRSGGLRAQQAQHDSGVTVRPNPGRRNEPIARSVMPASEPVTLRPVTFDDVKGIADRYKEGYQIIINVQSADPVAGRRIVDFASGVCYASGGSIEKVSNGVFKMKHQGMRATRN